MENRKLLGLIILLISIFLLMSNSICFAGRQWILFHDKEIKGHVVDIETNKQIEGAIVV